MNLSITMPAFINTITASISATFTHTAMAVRDIAAGQIAVPSNGKVSLIGINTSVIKEEWEANTVKLNLQKLETLTRDMQKQLEKLVLAGAAISKQTEVARKYLEEASKLDPQLKAAIDKDGLQKLVDELMAEVPSKEQFEEAIAKGKSLADQADIEIVVADDEASRIALENFNAIKAFKDLIDATDETKLSKETQQLILNLTADLNNCNTSGVKAYNDLLNILSREEHDTHKDADAVAAIANAALDQIAENIDASKATISSIDDLAKIHVSAKK